jgi:TonB family protein
MMIRLLLFLPLLCAVAAFGQSSAQQDTSLPRSGLVLVDADLSGKVTGAKILKSTGVREYDEAALRKFR